MGMGMDNLEQLPGYEVFPSLCAQVLSDGHGRTRILITSQRCLARGYPHSLTDFSWLLDVQLQRLVIMTLRSRHVGA